MRSYVNISSHKLKSRSTNCINFYQNQELQHTIQDAELDILIPESKPTEPRTASLTGAYLNCAIARHAPTRALRSASDVTLLAVTVPRRTVGKCSFAVAGPTMWNSLPKSVRTIETLAAFRKHLKTHLFRLHYLP